MRRRRGRRVGCSSSPPLVAAKRRPRQGGVPKSAAKGIIEAGAPAFGCTVHPLRLQAPRAAYAHKSPGQGDCTATPGWPGGRDGRKSIKSKIIDTKAADSAIVGNMPYLRRTASLRRMLAPEGPGYPRRIPRPVRSRRCRAVAYIYSGYGVLDQSYANFRELRVCELRRIPKRRSSQNSSSTHSGE